MVLRRAAEDRTLVDVATREMREVILSGELKPGQQLVLTELAQRLSMSVMPVREAIGRLQGEGLVDQIPHRGARVSPVSSADLEDLYAVRIALETLATREAAAKFTEEDYERLAGVLEQYAKAYEADDAERGREMHSQFHLGIYELSGSPWVMRTIPALWDAADRYRRLSATLRGTLKDRYEEHQHILECCQRRDPAGAAAALEEHLCRTMTVVKAEIGDQERMSEDGREI